MAENDVAAESSPATDAPVAERSGSEVLSSLTTEQYRHWESTGELPTETPAEAPLAESSPADQTEQAKPAESTEPPAAGAQPRKGKDAESRKAQLAAEVKAALAQREQVRRELAEEQAALNAIREQRRSGVAAPQQPQAASPTATPQPPSGDREPQLADFENGQHADPYTAYLRALGRWEARQEFAQQERQRIEREQARAAEAETQQRFSKFQQQMDAASTADPEFLATLSPDVLALRPFSALKPNEQPGPMNALAEEVVSSDIAPQVLRHFSDHPAELQRFGRMTPRQLLVEFGRLEARLSVSQPAAPAAPAQGTPAPKLPSAPPPPTTLGHKPATAAMDEAADALRRGDFAAYERATNARETAAHR